MRKREFQERFAPDRTRSSELAQTESNRLRERTAASYEGTRIDAEDVDTAFPSDANDDIDARFGASTRYVSSRELEPRFSNSYQLDSYGNRGGLPPKGIFDDV